MGCTATAAGYAVEQARARLPWDAVITPYRDGAGLVPAAAAIGHATGHAAGQAEVLADAMTSTCWEEVVLDCPAERPAKASGGAGACRAQGCIRDGLCVAVSDLTQVFCVFIMRLGALVACITLEYSACPRQFTQDCKLMGSRWWHRLLRPCSNYGQHPQGAQWAGCGHSSVRTHSSFIIITDDFTMLTETGSAS